MRDKQRRERRHDRSAASDASATGLALDRARRCGDGGVAGYEACDRNGEGTPSGQAAGPRPRTAVKTLGSEALVTARGKRVTEESTRAASAVLFVGMYRA